MDIYTTVRNYMKEGLTLNEAISKVESDLHGTFPEELKARIRTEINFTRDLKIEQADKKALLGAYR